MEKAMSSHYEQGINTLDDLQVLADADMSPLINRAFFHFSELKRNIEFETGKVKTYSKIHNFLDYYLESAFQKFYLDRENVKQVIIEKNLENLSFERWDRLLDVLPATLFSASLFDFVGLLNINISESSLVFKGEIEENYKIEKYRKQIYALTRKLLKSQTLLTFSLNESEKEGRFELELSINIGHCDSRIFSIDLIEERGILLGFSNVFEDYRLTIEQAKNLGRHFCVEVTEDLKVQKFYRIPDRFSRENMEVEIMHFPFLFRPVSIIIPKRGSTIQTSTLRHLGDTGSANSVTEQDVGKCDSYHYRYIDFFSLIV